MKKFLYLALSLVLVLAMTACGSDEKKTDEKADSEEKSTEESADGKDASSEESNTKDKTGEEEFSEDDKGEDANKSFSDTVILPSVEEQVLYDENNLKFSVKAADTKLDILHSDVEIPVIFENNSEETYSIFFNNIEVNGLTLGTFSALVLESETAPGTVNETVMHISIADLEHSGISKLADIKCDIAFSPERSLDSVEAKDVEIKTSLSGQVEQEIDTSGTVMYDQDGVKLILRDELVETVLGPAVVFYFENETDSFVKLSSVDKIKINGKETDETFINSLKPHAKAVLTESYLIDEPITSIEMKLKGENGEFMGDEIIAPFEVKKDF